MYENKVSQSNKSITQIIRGEGEKRVGSGDIIYIKTVALILVVARDVYVWPFLLELRLAMLEFQLPQYRKVPKLRLDFHRCGAGGFYEPHHIALGHLSSVP